MTPVVLRSPLLDRIGVPHGFTTRIGGVSGGIFSSLNFGNPMELTGPDRDPVSNIEENFRRTLACIGAPGREVTQVYQVHGSAARAFRRGGPSRDHGPDGPRDFKADALITDDASRVVAVRVADCAPVLLASADGCVVCAVHAGWRGVIAGVIRGALKELRSLGATGIVAAVGPCIGPDAFEVGPEVLAEFRRVFGATAPVRDRPDGKGFVDLRESLRAQLVGEGVEQVDVLARCTFSEPTQFFSHRRDHGLTGRMVGLVGPR